MQKNIQRSGKRKCIENEGAYRLGCGDVPQIIKSQCFGLKLDTIVLLIMVWVFGKGFGYWGLGIGV